MRSYFLPPALTVVLMASACVSESRDYVPNEQEGVEKQPDAGEPAADSSTDEGSVDADEPLDAALEGQSPDVVDTDVLPCTPLTCQSANAMCGTIPDGCEGILDCGECPAGEQCGGSGLPNHCVALSDAGPDADAEPACTDGERECVGLQVYECDPTGDWVPAETCSTSCVSGACEDSCQLPWGGTLAHGQSTTAYLNGAETSPTLCSNNVETRTCNNAVLSGSYTSPTCAQQYRNCALAGYGTLLHGAQVSSYSSATVPCGSMCTTLTISCNDGTLTGGSSYEGSCVVDECTCDFAHGLGFVTLSPGQSCSTDFVNANTTSGCSGGAQHYDSYHCTYTCNSNGTVTRSAGGPCEIGNGWCGGSVSGYSTTTCPSN